MFINVKGTKYKLVYKKLTEKHGECNTERKIIYIDTEKKTQEKLHLITLVHEMVHAYLGEMYVSDIISSDLEEILCETVAHMVDEHRDLLLGIGDVSNN